LEAKIPAFIEKHAAEQIKTILGGTLSSELQPLKDIYLHSHRIYEIGVTGDIRYLYIFSVVGIFILLIACINYMNLSAARSANRAREVGFRKVIGANRKQFIKQFIGESLLVTLFASIISSALVILTLPYFNMITGKEFEIKSIINPLIAGLYLLVIILVGITAGSYPAFVMSRFQPVKILQGVFSRGAKGPMFRKILVITQFAISTVLIICTLVIIDQLDYMQNRKLGFDKEHVLIVPITRNTMRTNAEIIKNELFENPNILSATISIGVPGGIKAGDTINVVTDEGLQRHTLQMYYTNHDFIRTMGMEIIKGRDFSKEMSTDEQEAFIVNETIVRYLRLKEPLETQLIWSRGGEFEKRGKIIGVVKDFQFASLKNEISPLVIHIFTPSTRIFAMRIRPENTPETIKFVEKKWQELDPAHPFEYSFLDETFDNLYKSEAKMSTIFRNFSILAIFIAMLGLFGLATFLAEQRTLEIGIRKILGAPVRNILLLTIKELVLLVIIANIFAWPLAYFSMKAWLNNFAYRISIEIEVFILGASISLFFALLTVNYNSVKSTLRNPVDTLRIE